MEIIQCPINSKTVITENKNGNCSDTFFSKFKLNHDYYIKYESSEQPMVNLLKSFKSINNKFEFDDKTRLIKYLLNKDGCNEQRYILKWVYSLLRAYEFNLSKHKTIDKATYNLFLDHISKSNLNELQKVIYICIFDVFIKDMLQVHINYFKETVVKSPSSLLVPLNLQHYPIVFIGHCLKIENKVTHHININDLRIKKLKNYLKGSTPRLFQLNISNIIEEKNINMPYFDGIRSQLHKLIHNKEFDEVIDYLTVLSEDFHVNYGDCLTMNNIIETNDFTLPNSIFLIKSFRKTLLERINNKYKIFERLNISALEKRKYKF